MRGIRLVAVGILLAAAIPHAAAAQADVSLSWQDKPDHKVVSPDGKYALFNGRADSAEVWIEEVSTHTRRYVMSMNTGVVSVGWAPDSHAFYLNNHVASNVDRAYLYDAQTLDQLDLAALVVGADRKARRFTAPFVLEPPKFGSRVRVADHSHLEAARWLDAGHVDVFLDGHTDATGSPEGDGPPFRPVQCFSLHYRISKSGEVRKLGQQVASAESKACERIEGAS
jgi:hypothetical protein